MSRTTVFIAVLEVVAITFCISPAVAQKPGKWMSTASMNTARQAFTATLLPSGKVLVAGGCLGGSGDPYCDGASATNFAELYDPSNGTWTATSAMATPRLAHTATLLPSGKVLVAGGTTANCLTTETTELYDPNTSTWSVSGSLNTSRSAHAATLIGSGPLAGMVLVAGGFINQNDGGCGGDPQLDSAELYDPSTGVWLQTGTMTRQRDFPLATALPDGSVLVVGMLNCCPYHWFNSAELFDPTTQTWMVTGANTTPGNGRAVLLGNGQVMVAGGVQGTQPTSTNVAAAELFTLSSSTWSPTSSMSIDRAGHTLTLLPDGEVLASGGYDGGWGVCNVIKSSELYDIDSGKWSLTGNILDARSSHTATLLLDGRVLVAGGADCAGQVLSSAELFTPPPLVGLSPGSLNFGNQHVGRISLPQVVTITNQGTAALTISGIGISGRNFADFIEASTCHGSLAPSTSCTIKVWFRPNALGSRKGAVSIADDGTSSPQKVVLLGNGT